MRSVKQPSKEEIIKLVNKGTRGLWTQTGSTLEHVVLWWCHTPLGTRPVACAKYLRDWLLNTQPDGEIMQELMINLVPVVENFCFFGRYSGTHSFNFAWSRRNSNGACGVHHMG